MTFFGRFRTATLTVLCIAVTGLWLSAEENPSRDTQSAPSSVAVHMVVTVQSTKGENTPSLDLADVFVRQGKNRLKVTEWIPARGEQSGLELFILIDDAATTQAGSYLEELRSFVTAQPPTTAVGVGYMDNATFSIAQNVTRDHDQAAKALRIPRGSTSASSPYLSLINLIKGWPPTRNRRAVIMLTDGIDRFRRGSEMNRSRTAALAPMSPDVDSASNRAQRDGVIVYTIFVQGVGHYHRNYYEINLGQNSQTKLTDETGGDSFMLGQGNPVSLKPYLGDIQTTLNNQYIIGFEITPKKKAGLQTVDISTEVPNIEIIAANSVWVRAAE
jgi:hypothetical protein